jgi:two-component system response regulator MprA
MRILVVEDEHDLAGAVAAGLRREGYAVDVAGDGRSALDRLGVHAYDMVCLDLNLPDADGLDICRHVVTAPRPGDGTADAPRILVLSARDRVEDRIVGLDHGADDYLVKPFALEELLARLRALLRRTGGDGGPLSFADLSLDPATHEVHRGDRAIELTRTEFLLLELFLRNPRQVLTRDVIFDRVWGYDFGPTSNSLEVYVGYLRRKTEAGGEPRLIQTVRGVGYALREST